MGMRRRSRSLLVLSRVSQVNVKKPSVPAAMTTASVGMMSVPPSGRRSLLGWLGPVKNSLYRLLSVACKFSRCGSLAA